MNRTERAIKKQYRQAQLQQKALKQAQVDRMKSATSGSLIDYKQMAANEVKRLSSTEKEARKDVIEYKIRAKSIRKEAAIA